MLGLFLFCEYKICITVIKEKALLHSGVEWRWRRWGRWIRQQISHDRNAQNLRCIKQRKRHYFIQFPSADKDDEYDSGIFTDRNAQNLRRIKQRKGFCFFQTSSDNKNHQDDGRITPYTFQDFRTEVQLPQQNTPCWSLCADLCDSFKEIGKVPASGHSGLKSKISEKMLFQPRYTSPMHKICFALNKEKGFASFRVQVTMRTIRAMTWFFHIADYCTDLLVYPNNREFTWSNRVYGHFCWNCFWEILSYTQGEFWIM